MDALINDIGEPPYQATVFEAVVRDGKATLDGVFSGTLPLDIPEITRAVERLEALASIIFRTDEMDFLTWTQADREASTADLAGVIWKLKQELLGHESPSSEGRGVCSFCGWALARIGSGLVGTSHVGCGCVSCF